MKYAIALGEQHKKLREEVLIVKDRLRGVFSERTCKNWATLLFFLKKVSIINIILQVLEHSKESLPFEDVVKFAANQARPATMVPTSLEPEQLMTTTVQEIVSFCKTKSLIEVKRKKFLVGCLKPIVVLFQIKVLCWPQ